MPYYELTSTEQIRAVLTVSPADLSDETIEGYGLEDNLGNYLDKNLKDKWEQIIATGPASQLRKLKLIAKYFCAGTLAVTAQAFILKKLTDGSNEGQRSDKDGWKWLTDDLLGKADEVLDELIDELGLTPEPILPYNVMTRVVPDRDPITTPRPLNVS